MRCIALLLLLILPLLAPAQTVDGGEAATPGSSAAPVTDPKPGDRREIDLGGGVTMGLVWIPAGSFQMGSNDGEPHEKPMRTATLTRGFWMGETEVTVGAWKRFVAETSYRSTAEVEGSGWADLYGGDQWSNTGGASWRNAGFPQSDSHPVVLVSWNDTLKFNEWLSRKSGGTVSLPTEAQWEYACRAGTSSKYFWGDKGEDHATHANIADQSAKKKFSSWNTSSANDGFVYTAPVSSFRNNAFGLHDMHGNVWEWCQDWYHDSYDGLATTDPVNSSGKWFRVFRGGSWFDFQAGGLSAARNGFMPDFRSYFIGFRVFLHSTGQTAHEIPLAISPGGVEEAVGLQERVKRAHTKLGLAGAADDAIMAIQPDLIQALNAWEGGRRERLLIAIEELDPASEDSRIAFADRRWKEMAATPQPTPEATPTTSTASITNPKPRDRREIDLGGGVTMGLVWIPAGSFQMGSNERNRGAGPVRTVTLTKGFWMGETEVTVAAWKRFVAETSYLSTAELKGSGYADLNGDRKWVDDKGASWKNSGFHQTDSHPVVLVSWIDTVKFNEWLSRKVGETISLPTEAEWEYACRAGTSSKYFWGDEGGDHGPYANFGDQALQRKLSSWTPSTFHDGFIYTSPAGSFRKNDFGVRDMHGNAAEWCQDWYQMGYGGLATTDPVNNQAGMRGMSRVIRGGSWEENRAFGMSHSRTMLQPDGRSSRVGFRVASYTTLHAEDWVSRKGPVATVTDLPSPGSTPAPTSTSSIQSMASISSPGSKAGDRASITVNGVEFAFIWCPPGTFQMGSPSSEQGRWNQEDFQTTVTLTRGFWLGETEVTQRQWQAIMGSDPSNLAYPGNPDNPVERVSWNDIIGEHPGSDRPTPKSGSFLARLNAASGLGFTLPTEAQWEYACRAGTTSRYAFGDDESSLGEYAWYSANAGRKTQPVKTRKPNGWGLHDMHGNVWEWCLDSWVRSHPGLPNMQDYCVVRESPMRVNRGGSWNDVPRDVRSATRDGDTPDLRFSILGFRLCINN